MWKNARERFTIKRQPKAQKKMLSFFHNILSFL